jgi:hypothetical protein
MEIGGRRRLASVVKSAESGHGRMQGERRRLATKVATKTDIQNVSQF